MTEISVVTVEEKNLGVKQNNSIKVPKKWQKDYLKFEILSSN